MDLRFDIKKEISGLAGTTILSSRCPKKLHEKKKSNLGKIITKREAELFLERFNFPALKSISVFGGRSAIVSYRERKTSPNVVLFGSDENFLLLNGFSLRSGRDLNNTDVQTGRNVCMIGHDVAKTLFGENVDRAVNVVIQINNIPFRVVGVLDSRGSTFGFSRDNLIVTSYENVSRNFPGNFSYTIAIMTNNIKQVDEAMGEAESIFRTIRKLNITEENNFVLDRSDSVAEKAMNTLGFSYNFCYCYWADYLNWRSYWINEYYAGLCF